MFIERLMLELNSNTLTAWCWHIDSFEKILDSGKIEEWRRRGCQRMRWLMAWVWVNSGFDDGQGGLTRCSPGCRVRDIIERLSWTETVFLTFWKQLHVYRSTPGKKCSLYICIFNWSVAHFSQYLLQGYLNCLVFYYHSFYSVNNYINYYIHPRVF